MSAVLSKAQCLRFTRLKLIAKSPAHYAWSLTEDMEETLSMRLGSGCHAIAFGTPFVVFTGKKRAGKEWEAFEIEHAGKLILNATEHRKAQAMADALRRDPVASSLLFAPGTIHEQLIEWDWNGRPCRSTPDARRPGVVIDLKSCRDASPRKLRYQARDLSYHAQVGFYSKAVETICEPVRERYLVAIESTEPFPVTVLHVGQADIDEGLRLCDRWRAQLEACEASDRWPAYASGVLPFSVADETEEDDGFFDDDADKESEAA